MATQSAAEMFERSPSVSDSIRSAWADYVSSSRTPPARRQYVYASAWRACDRRLVLEMTDGDKMPAWNAETLANFRRGNDRERDLLSDLKRIGRLTEPPFELIGEQERFELKGRAGQVVIVGKVDARIRYRNGPSLPVEVKAWNPNTVARISCFEDLFAGTWTRGGAYQMLSYLYGAGEQTGLMILDRAGLPLLLDVELYRHLDKVEGFLTRAEAAIAHATDGTLPPFTNDAEECKRCPFYGSVCNPPLGANVAQILADPELETILDRREELSEAAKEYEALDADVKKRLRGIESAVAGKYLIEGKWARSTSYEIPAEVKKKYAKTDEHGRFTLKITKL